MSNSTIRPYVRPKIKDPMDDTLIRMSKERREKELKNESNARQMSVVSGSMLHKMHELNAMQKEIRILQDGVDEYQGRVDLLNDRKSDLNKMIAKHKVRLPALGEGNGARRSVGAQRPATPRKGGETTRRGLPYPCPRRRSGA